MAFSLVFAAALAVTNNPASFSTAVERTFPCPVIGEPAVGRRYTFTIPESGGGSEGAELTDRVALMW